MANTNSERMVTVSMALGRPVSQKPDTIMLDSASSIQQAGPERIGLGCIRTDYCEGFFTLESSTSGYDIILDPISGKNSIFEMEASQSLPQQTTSANGAPAPRVIEFRATITTDLTKANAAEDTMLTVGLTLGRPVSQKPDSVLRSSGSAISQMAPPRTAWACSDMERCEAVFNLDSIGAGYSIALSSVTRPNCVFDIKVTQQAANSAPQQERVIILEVKMFTN